MGKHKKSALTAVVALLALMLFAKTLPGGSVAAPAEADSGDSAPLFLMVGSPLALSEDRVLSLDAQNKKLAPMLSGDHTLVPLTAIGQHFGAAVSYDAAARQAVIQTADNRAEFPIDGTAFTLNGEGLSLPVSTRLEGDRVLVPLRAICERVLGLSVTYRDGVIAVGQDGLTALQAETVTQRIGQYLRLGSLEQLQALVTDVYDGAAPGGVRRGTQPAMQDSATGDGAQNASARPPTAEADQRAPQADFSGTNIQTQGVDEGDVVKTDGTFLYLCRGDQLKIIAANGSNPTVAGELSLGEGTAAMELYVDGGNVIVVGTRTQEQDGTRVAFVDGTFTFVRTYDVSTPFAPKLTREYEISGYPVTSRRQGGMLYLLTRYYGTRGADPRPFADGVPIAMEDILVPRKPTGGGLSTLSAIDTRNPLEPVVSETVLSGEAGTYMSNSAFYVAGIDYGVYEDGSPITHIAKFALEGSSIGYAGSGVVEGTLLNQFSLDEYEGCLRVATTDFGTSANHLTVLDADMRVVGAVKGYAPGERIYSARFLGSRGYVVTFRETDPLFVFDLSDPQNPVITGQLKVPGFSSYLHPISDTVLLGVGQDVGDLILRSPSGEEVVVGQQTAGMKLSLFDVSDAGKPVEIDTLVLGTSGTSELLSNHRAAMFRPDRAQLCFPLSLLAPSQGEDDFTGMSMISYRDNTLEELGRLPYENPYTTYEETAGKTLYLPDRAVYIGEVLYYVQDGLLRCFDYNTLEEIGRLALRED